MKKHLNNQCPFCGTTLIPWTDLLQHDEGGKDEGRCPMRGHRYTRARWAELRRRVEQVRADATYLANAKLEDLQALLTAACRMLRRSTWSKRAEDELLASSAYLLTNGRAGRIYKGVLHSAVKRLITLQAKARQGKRTSLDGGA